MDDKADLVAFARDSAMAGVDLYELLGVDTTTSREDIHRAWRRQGLKYHPDKAGANFDPALYERFARARDVLVDDAARQVYDTARTAAAQRKMQADQMTAERRRFKDELEAAEKAAGGGTSTAMAGETPFRATPSSGPPESTEREKLREAGRRRAEERQRQEQEAQERLRQREDARIAEIEKLLREKEERAKRRAEKKAARSGGAAPATETTSKTEQKAYKTFAAPAESEWKKLVGNAKEEGPVQQRPLFAYTLNRLKAAGEVQRRQQAEAAGVETPAFEPQWQEIEDPQVRKFITRVPRLSSVPAQAADVKNLAQ